jgi:hypothetical protein
VADTFKRGALSNYYNSQIRNLIIGAKVLKMQLIVSLLALSFMTVFDIVGSFSTANYVEAKYQEFQATNSKEFELLESNAKNGQSELAIYSQELAVWQQDKKLAYQACNEKYKRWKAHYKADCKEEWDNDPKNAKPKRPTTSGSVSVSDYKSVKEDTNSDFLSEYIFYIILFLSLALTMLLQYTTISEIQNNKDEIDQSLTSMVIGILQDRLSELETNMVQHETKRNELISDGDKEEKRLGREFEKMGKGISLLSMGKAVDARGQTVKRIANNEAMPTTSKKAGFVDVSFSPNQRNESKGKNFKDGLTWIGFANETTAIELIRNGITNVLSATKHIDANNDNSIYYTIDKFWFYSVVQDKFNLQDLQNDINNLLKESNNDPFDGNNTEFLIRRLWNDGKIKANKKLTPKAKVINIKKRKEVTKIGDLYRILLEVKAVETKSANSGYYSLVDMETAISLYWKWRLM